MAHLLILSKKWGAAIVFTSYQGGSLCRENTLSGPRKHQTRKVVDFWFQRKWILPILWIYLSQTRALFNKGKLLVFFFLSIGSFWKQLSRRQLLLAVRRYEVFEQPHKLFSEKQWPWWLTIGCLKEWTGDWLSDGNVLYCGEEGVSGDWQ